MEMSFTCTFIFLQIKLISVWKVVHKGSCTLGLTTQRTTEANAAFDF